MTSVTRLATWVGLATIVFAIGGCPWLRSAESPMPAVSHAAHGPAVADALIVMMPGFGDGPDHYVDNGFVKQVQALPGQKFDVVAVDAHYGYYRAFSIIDRLRTDVILPALEKGYRKIWLVGISMGGFGAISYAQRHPADIEGVVILAPYLGDGDVVDAVVEQGLAKWQPPAGLDTPDPEGDEEERHSNRVWRFIKSYAQGQGDKPTVIIGWGEDDSLRTPAKQVASVLPPDRVFTRPGGHKWTTWRPLFKTMAPKVWPPR